MLSGKHQRKTAAISGSEGMIRDPPKSVNTMALMFCITDINNP
jgi:hypothetical protein